MSDGTVKAWGYNSYGQLGDNTTTNRTSPITISGLSGVQQVVASFNHTLALMADGTVKAWGANASGQLGDNTTTNRTSPTTISGLSGVKQLVAGDSSTLALMTVVLQKIREECDGREVPPFVQLRRPLQTGQR